MSAAAPLQVPFTMPTPKDWSRANPNVCYFLTMQAGRNPLAVGEPGCGKTQTNIQFARATGRRIVVLLGSTMMPEDVGGIPHVYQMEQFFRKIPDEMFHHLAEPGWIVFADELTTCPAQVKSSLLTFFSDRRVGNMTVHPDNWIAAACNPPKWAPNASPLEKAMANRFSHYQWEHNFEGFCSGMESEDNNFDNGFIPVLPDDWHRMKTKWGYLITGYLRKNSTERSMIPDNDEELAFPTYRTWHALRDILSAADSVGAPENIHAKLAAGTVGRTVGSNFLRYVAQLDLIDPEALLAGTAKFTFDRRRIDMAAALLASLVSCLRQNYTPDRMEKAVAIFCEDVGKHAKDLVFTQLRPLVNARPEGQPLPRKAVEMISEFGSKNVPQAVRNKSK